MTDPITLNHSIFCGSSKPLYTQENWTVFSWTKNGVAGSNLAAEKSHHLAVNLLNIYVYIHNTYVYIFRTIENIRFIICIKQYQYTNIIFSNRMDKGLKITDNQLTELVKSCDDINGGFVFHKHY